MRYMTIHLKILFDKWWKLHGKKNSCNCFHIGLLFSNFSPYVQLNIVEGKMQYLFDESGRRYLDAFAGIVTVSCGHCHPEILEAITEQSKLLQHATTIYLHHAIADYAEALASKMPGNLKASMLNFSCSLRVMIREYLMFAEEYLHPCIILVCEVLL